MTTRPTYAFDRSGAMADLPYEPDRPSVFERLQRRHAEDEAAARALRRALAQATLDDWRMPPVAAAARGRLRALDARAAVRALSVAGFFALARATIMPWSLAALLSEQELSQHRVFAAYADPNSQIASLGLAAFFFACMIAAARRPLLGASAALIAFLAVSIPFLADNPDPLSGPNLGRAVTTLILMRAVLAGVSFRLR